MASQSSIAISAELAALLAALSSGAQLQFLDTSNDVIATAPLGDPPGVVVGQGIVLLGLPAYAQVSSQAPVGNVAMTATIVNDAGQPIISGLQVVEPTNSISIALPSSSGIIPGGQFGVIGGSISIP